MKSSIGKLTIFALFFISTQNLRAQCPTIICPSDTVVMNDSGVCEAVVNYQSPIVQDTCSAGPGTVLVISDIAGATEIEPVLTAEGYSVTVVTNDYVGGDNTVLQGSLAAYDLVIWHAVGGGSGGTHNSATFVNLSAYINSGGAIMVHGYDIIASPTDPELITFLGGTSSVDVPGGGGLGVIAGPANSLTDGVTNIVGLTLANGGDHDALVTLTGGTVGVAPNNSGWDWSLRTLGSGEIAWVSTGQSSGTFTNWSTPNSGYHEALLNFAYAHSSPSPILTLTSGMASGSAFPVGTTTIEYEVTDWQGNNPQTCSFNITVNSSIDTSITANGTLLSAAPQLATYQWLDCDNNYAVINNEVNQFFEPGVTGSYAVEITNIDGCVDTTACILADYTGVDELLYSSLTISPNPSTGLVIVEMNDIEFNSISVMDNQGRVIFESTENKKSSHKLDLSEREPGTYFCRVVGDFGVISKKIIIQ